MIRNLFHPEGSSVNDYDYATIQAVISFIKESESIVLMAKVDIEAAFRIIPVAPKEAPLLGFKCH